MTDKKSVEETTEAPAEKKPAKKEPKAKKPKMKTIRVLATNIQYEDEKLPKGWVGELPEDFVRTIQKMDKDAKRSLRLEIDPLLDDEE